MHHYWIFMSCSSPRSRSLVLLFGHDDSEDFHSTFALHTFLFSTALHSMYGIVYECVYIFLWASSSSTSSSSSSHSFNPSFDRYVELPNAIWEDIQKWYALHFMQTRATNNKRARLVARYWRISAEHWNRVRIYTIYRIYSGWIELIIASILYDYMHSNKLHRMIHYVLSFYCCYYYYYY